MIRSRSGPRIVDFVYLIGPITRIAGPAPFLLATGLGTLGYLLWTLAAIAHLAAPKLKKESRHPLVNL